MKHGQNKETLLKPISSYPRLTFLLHCLLKKRSALAAVTYWPFTLSSTTLLPSILWNGSFKTWKDLNQWWFPYASVLDILSHVLIYIISLENLSTLNVMTIMQSIHSFSCLLSLSALLSSKPKHSNTHWIHPTDCMYILIQKHKTNRT